MQQDSCETIKAVFGVFSINKCVVDRTDRKQVKNGDSLVADLA
jgi:hypothetical protein